MTSSLPTVWDIVSNLNLHVKKSFYEHLSKHRDNKIIKDIYLLTSKLSTMAFFQHGFLFVKVWLQHQLYRKFYQN